MKRTARATTKTSTLDPQLVAFLLYISGAGQNGNDALTESATNEFEIADRHARSLLTSHPIASAFAEEADRPTVDAGVLELARFSATGQVAAALELKTNDPSGDLVDALRFDVGRAGVVLGACLMYRLMTGVR